MGFFRFAMRQGKCGAAPGPGCRLGVVMATPRRNALLREAISMRRSMGVPLSGPKYYRRFHAVTMDLVTREGVNQFKFDGTGNANEVIPGSRFDSDFEAAIALIQDLRAAKPDLFINLTTGTYPSPTWLRYADTIWRDGDDHNFAGVGPWRERWITYRDQQTYENIVIGGPLFPINSLMLHGIVYASHAAHLDSDPANDFENEVHGIGTWDRASGALHHPFALTSKNWDTLAQAARWSRANADVLKDTHWIGGDPGRLEVYGWAAWSPENRSSRCAIPIPESKPICSILDAHSNSLGTHRKIITRNPSGPKVLWRQANCEPGSLQKSRSPRSRSRPSNSIPRTETKRTERRSTGGVCPHQDRIRTIDSNPSVDRDLLFTSR